MTRDDPVTLMQGQYAQCDMRGGRVHRRAGAGVNDQSRWNSCKGARSGNQKAKVQEYD
jgi:hypothetical protein